jgi:drug/metabolite transporter (DMT)-like permease
MGWFGATLAATLIYGVLQAIQKIAASRGAAPLRLVHYSAVTVASLGLAAVLLGGGWPQLAPSTWIHAALNSVLFTAGSTLMLASLGRAPAAVALPVSKLDAVFVVAIGALAFEERPTGLQWLGVGAGLAVVAILTVPSRGRVAGRRPEWKAISFAVGAAACFAASMTVGRLAARGGPLLPFVTISYAFTALLSLLAARIGPGAAPGRSAGTAAPVWRYGVAIGALNFAGYLLILRAFALGPMALIQPLFASSMLLAVAISGRALGERLAARHVAAIGCSLVAIALIRLGS